MRAALPWSRGAWRDASGHEARQRTHSLAYAAGAWRTPARDTTGVPSRRLSAINQLWTRILLSARAPPNASVPRRFRVFLLRHAPRLSREARHLPSDARLPFQRCCKPRFSGPAASFSDRRLVVPADVLIRDPNEFPRRRTSAGRHRHLQPLVGRARLRRRSGRTGNALVLSNSKRGDSKSSRESRSLIPPSSRSSLGRRFLSRSHRAVPVGPWRKRSPKRRQSSPPPCRARCSHSNRAWSSQHWRGRHQRFARAREVLAQVAEDESAPSRVRADAFALLVRIVVRSWANGAGRVLHREWVSVRPGDTRGSACAPTIASRLAAERQT